MKQIVLFVAVILSILLAFAVAWQLISIVLLFIVSLVIAATVRAPIDFLTRRGMRRTIAITVVYVGLLGILAGLTYFVSLSLMNEMNLLWSDSTTIYTRLQMSWQNGGRLGSLLADRLPSSEQVAELLAGDYLDELTAGTITATQSAINMGSQLVLALILSIYWTADRVGFERLWLSLLPTTHRMRARAIWRTLEDGVGAYTRSELAQSILAGALLFVGYSLLGLHYPFLWSLLVALSWLIPLVGGLLALIPFTLLNWFEMGPFMAIIATAYTIVVLILMEFMVERRLYKHSQYQRVLVLVIMLAVADLYGLVGLIIAPFIATAVQIFLGELLTGDLSEPFTTSEINYDIDTLQARLGKARALLDNQEDETAIRLQSMSERLDLILTHVEDIQPNEAKHPLQGG